MKGWSLLKVDMPILTCILFTFNWLTLISEMHFVKFNNEVASCLLSRGKKVCTPGDEAIMKIHKKLFHYFIHFVISPKLQRIWSWNFGFAIRKIWAFIWYEKYTTSGWALGDENVICIRAFNYSVALNNCFSLNNLSSKMASSLC